MGNVTKEILKETTEAGGRIGLGMRYSETSKKNSGIKGEFFITLKHKDGKEEKYYRNIIVDSASILIARLLADGQTTLDPTGPAHGIWVLAVGTGNASWDSANPPAATSTQTQLESELARKKFANVNFVKTDGSGLPASEITNIVDFQTVLSESEAVGPIMELGLFGGDADETVANSGTLVNYRTLPVINKSNTSSMSILLRLTT